MRGPLLLVSRPDGLKRGDSSPKPTNSRESLAGLFTPPIGLTIHQRDEWDPTQETPTSRRGCPAPKGFGSSGLGRSPVLYGLGQGPAKQLPAPALPGSGAKDVPIRGSDSQPITQHSCAPQVLGSTGTRGWNASNLGRRFRHEAFG